MRSEVVKSKKYAKTSNISNQNPNPGVYIIDDCTPHYDTENALKRGKNHEIGYISIQIIKFEYLSLIVLSKHCILTLQLEIDC